MLHLVNKFLYKKHLDRYGCVGIFCESNKISSIHLMRDKDRINCENLSELIIDDIEKYADFFRKTIKIYEEKPTPICIGMSLDECIYDVMPVSAMPINKKAHDSFVRWRYEKLFDKKINQKNFSYVQLEMLPGKNCVAVSTGFELLKSVISECENSDANIQFLAPSVLAYPTFLESIFDVDINYSIILKIDRNSWCLSFVGNAEVIFCRHQPWLKEMDMALLCLKQDIDRLDSFFRGLLGSENGFPIYIITDDELFFNIEKFQHDLQRAIWLCKSENCLSYVGIANGEIINVEALAVAVKGMNLYG